MTTDHRRVLTLQDWPQSFKHLPRQPRSQAQQLPGWHLRPNQPLGCQTRLREW